jgi:alcohol dehydrogenase (cytochrome c)
MSLSSLRARALALLIAVPVAACSSATATSQGAAGETAPKAAPSSAAVALAPAGADSSAFPNAAALANAAADDDDWILPGKTYANNRYTGLDQIGPRNVKTLAKAWTTAIADDGQQEASPIVWHGTMYLSTPHESVLALDAKTGKLKWQFPYNPSYVLLFAVNRGVGIADGKVFLATQDCRVIALDATNGKKAWDVNGCPATPYASTKNTFFSMAAYVYRNKIILGTAGGDNGSIGHVLAFSTKDGHKLWDWQTIPNPGEPGHDTWPGTSWQHGGAPVWSGLAIDQQTQTLFIAPGNPGPDLVDTHRKGRDLYTDSIVALDIAGARPKLRWYYQILQNDTHDADPAMPPVIFDGKVGSTTRHLVAVGDKAADFVILDRTNGKVVYRMALDHQVGINDVPTLTGERACPNHGGGIEWNGGAYDPGSNLFLVPSTEECAVFKLLTTDPQYVAGQPYEGGPLPKRQAATGKLTAIDVTSGKVAWTHPFPYPGEGGALVTKTGLAFTTDVGGHLYAFDAKSGKLLWRGDTGSSNVSALSAYRVDGQEYIALVSGQAGNQQTPNLPAAHGSFVTAYRLGPVASAIVNTAAGQVAVAPSAGGENLPASTGTAPYTSAQVAAGAQAYAQSCANCHGAQLQGISAPALTGASFARAHLNLSQVRTVVTTQMPLTAPGSLKPQQYADIMAFLLSYDCVKASPGNAPFPTSDSAAFSKVVFGGESCPAKPAGHE